MSSIGSVDAISLSSESSEAQSEFISNVRTQRADRSTQKKGKRRAVEMSPCDDDLLEQAVAAMSQKNDEFDIFGQYVASELRQMSDPFIQRMVKNEILQSILNAGSMIVTSAGNVQQTFVQTSTQPVIETHQMYSFNDSNQRHLSMNEF